MQDGIPLSVAALTRPLGGQTAPREPGKGVQTVGTANDELWSIAVNMVGSSDPGERASAMQAIDSLTKRGSARELVSIASTFAGSADPNKQAAAMQAIDALGERGARKELGDIANRFAKLTDPNKRVIARRAIDALRHG